MISKLIWQMFDVIGFSRCWILDSGYSILDDPYLQNHLNAIENRETSIEHPSNYALHMSACM
jgi:hypothetical protein